MNLKGKVLAILMLLVSFASCINAGNSNATQKSRSFYDGILTDLNLPWYKTAYGYTFTDNGTVYNVIFVGAKINIDDPTATKSDFGGYHKILYVFFIPDGLKQKIINAGMDTRMNRYKRGSCIPQMKKNGLTKKLSSGNTKYKLRIYADYSESKGKTFNYDKTINIPDNIVKNIFDLVDGKTQYTWEPLSSWESGSEWLKNHEPFAGSSTTTTTTTTTKPKSNVNADISQSRMVDLGLSVKWANCNVGATSPEQYGGLYGWADITGTKTSRNVNLYPNSNPPTNICGDSRYDIARAKWGGNWRLPTLQEQKELKEKCTWQWTKFEGVVGYKVIGPNGNSIFLPAAGERDGKSIERRGEFGRYWSGTLISNPNTKELSWYLMLNGNEHYYLSTHFHYLGYSVRPVCD